MDQNNTSIAICNHDLKQVKKSIPFGNHTLTIETGEIARQATGAVMCSLDETVVLVTVVAKAEDNVERDFFPLTVNYQEKTYAAGKIPGGFLKREGRPSDQATLVSRLIDRPIRPLFPKGYNNEVQIVATVLSLDPEINSDIPAIVGASAALAISGLPFQGPIGAVRVGYQDGIFLLNPTKMEIEASSLNLVVAGTQDAVLMVESEAKELPESTMLGAVLYGHEMMQQCIELIKQFTVEAGRAPMVWQAPAVDENLQSQVAQLVGSEIAGAYNIPTKIERQEKLATIRQRVLENTCSSEQVAEGTKEKVIAIIDEIERNVVRKRILAGEPRIDGRDTKTVRPISIRTGFLPRVHGSALFTRGETQAIVAATLSHMRDAQLIDAIDGTYNDRYMFHYNFPPFSVGETGMMSSPKRREIGHGRLARRGTEALIPAEKDFPYAIRVVSEITESNGSSSMASVCGASLALMDAGVPMKTHVAGIAMGLVKEGNDFTVLTDILGDEDHLGDMDFKVAGTREGVTALQMDIKIKGITKEIMERALEQAKDGRLHILDLMNRALPNPRGELSRFAPRVFTVRIPTDRIGDVIGKGGATIRSITEDYGVDIDIKDDGSVQVFAIDQSSADNAIRRIKSLTEDVEVGKIYEGKVSKIVDFGAFVTILPGKDGLLHISQIAEQRVEKVTDFLTEGQMVKVKVLEVDRAGKIRLSMKALEHSETEKS